MKFLSITLQNDGETKTINLFDKTLIFSEENSVGKSTLLRLLFFGLGYPIPGTYGLKFKKINTKVYFERGKNIYLVKRVDNYIEIYRGDSFIYSCTLTGNDDAWFTFIWNIDSVRVLKNILGAIYMDQDKGWTLLNRGKVIGNIRFNIRDLLIGLSENESNLDDDLIRVDGEYKLLERTRQLRALGKSSEEYRNNGISELRKYNDTELSNHYQNLKLKQRILSQQLKDIKNKISNQRGLNNYLISLNIMVKIDQKTITINENNLLNFKNNLEFLKQKSAIMQEDKAELDAEIAKVKVNIEKQTSTLFDEVDVVEKTLNDIAQIHIDDVVLESREEELKKSISNLNSKIEMKFTDSNQLIDETRKWINLFAEKLGILDVVENREYIFTRDLKSISGTIYYKVVFAFKMAYIKVIQEHTGLTLPIVLDSPSGREVTNRNISAVIEILNNYFVNNQVIIASINKYELNNVHEIVLKNKIFENDVNKYSVTKNDQNLS